MFRKAHEEDTPLTRKIRSFMDRGELVPDVATNEMVQERLSEKDASNGFILDGYPRNFEQAKALDDILSDLGQKIDKVVRFMVTGDEIVARLSGRRVCPKCHTVYHMVTNPPKKDGMCDKDETPLIQREDDTEETVRRRLEVYGERTKPLYDFYGDRGVIVDVDAIGSSDEVFERLVEAVDSGGPNTHAPGETEAHAPGED